jgi:hypothetical protein
MADAKTEAMDKPNWADKGIGCAMLAKIMPELENARIGGLRCRRNLIRLV